MKIQFLEISDFQPIKYLKLENLGNTIIIAGANGSGKTRLKQAIVQTLQGIPVMNMTLAATRKEEEDPKYFNGKTIILEKGKKVILRGVNFQTNKATLTGDSHEILEMAYKALAANPDVQVEISGHTDSVGSDEANQALSLRRAQAVKNWLVQRGVRSDRMKTVGKGEKEPIADNGTAEGRTENRRIEFYVQQ